MWQKIKAWFMGLFGWETKEVVKEQAVPDVGATVPDVGTPEAPVNEVPPVEEPSEPGELPPYLVEPLVLRQWPVKVEPVFGEPLRERPLDGIPGWEHVHTRIGLTKFVIVRWRDPDSGLVRWVDKPPAVMPHQDWSHICEGVPDTTMPVWNFLWVNAESINNRDSEEGLQRLRDYDGGLRTDPEYWPEPYRTIYLESH